MIIVTCPNCSKHAPDDALKTLRDNQRKDPELRDQITDEGLPFCGPCLANKKIFRLEWKTFPDFPPQQERPPAEVVVIRVGPNKELEIEWFTKQFTHELDPLRVGWKQSVHSLPCN